MLGVEALVERLCDGSIGLLLRLRVFWTFVTWLHPIRLALCLLVSLSKCMLILTGAQPGGHLDHDERSWLPSSR